MATSINPVEKGIYDKLTAASALTSLLASGSASVFSNLAPETANTPYVVFNAQSPSVPIKTMGGTTGGVKFENAIYQVKGITQASSGTAAGSVADQIDAALADQTLTVTGYTHHLCRRQQNIDYVELGPGGERFNHRGALYRVVVS